MEELRLDYIFNSLLFCIDVILTNKLLKGDEETSFITSILESLILLSQNVQL